MANIEVDQLGQVLENWVERAPKPEELDDIDRDAQEALIQAGMV